MNAEPTFPPLLKGVEVDIGDDPFEAAIELADAGCDAGIVTYDITREYLRAAIIFAPEVPLSEAMAMLIACSIGFANALGALSPPEVAVHLGWDGTIYVNGATCGKLSVASNVYDPEEQPYWLVVGMSVALFPASDLEGGETPDETTLFQEGCDQVGPVQLLESWARHTLVWINRWTDDGPGPLHAEWSGMAYGLGGGITTDVTGETVTGKFIGADEDFGMLIKTNTGTVVKPLTELLYEDELE
jgi:biotin-(acetyl-CoA carboxylase) ligase